MRQSLESQAIFVAVSELMEGGERKTIREIRDELKARGLLKVDVEEMELEQARRAVLEHRKRCLKAKDVQREIVNLVDHVEDEEGNPSTVPYYKVFGAIDIDESAQLLQIVHDGLKRQNKKFFRYYNPLRKRHGAKLQRMLQFEIPEKMRDHVEALG